MLLRFMPVLLEVTTGTLLFTRHLDWRHPRRIITAGTGIILIGVCIGGLQSLEELPFADGTSLSMRLGAWYLQVQNMYYLLFSLALVAAIHWAFNASWLESLVTVAAGYTAQHTTFACVGALLATLQNTLYIYDSRLFPLRICCFAAAYTFIWVLIARQFTVDDATIRHKPLRVITSIILLLLAIVLNMQTQKLIYATGINAEVQTLLYVYDALVSFAALALLVTATTMDRMANDLAVIRQIDELKERQYELSRETIELVNTKFHDVRNNLASLRRTAQELQRMQHDGTADSHFIPDIPVDSIEQMEYSIRIYDSIFNTGDDALDTILMEKSLYCTQHGITFTAMADGAALRFMDRSDVYALFGNMLDNAIEAVSLVRDANSRQITFNLHADGRMLRIEEENYYSGTLQIRNGLPVTTKGDRRFHGFGMRSIARQVSKYRGDMTISTADHIFTLSIVLPIPAELSSASR